MQACVKNWKEELFSMASLFLKLDSIGSVRGAVTPQDNQIFSTNDFINLVCGKPVHDVYGKTTFQRIKENPEFKDEVDTSCIYYQFPGRGQKPTPCMTIRGLQRLLMILGGKVATEFRKIVEGTFTRVMAGDTSLIEVINANAASSAPIHQAYRQALNQEPTDPVLDQKTIESGKRKREERRFYMEMEERKQRLAESKLAHAKDSAEFLESLATLKNVDEYTKKQMRDITKTTLFLSVM